ncbi:MAG: acyl-CoA dehydrogenase, partial [Colwellia sp.]|nr:acyl-CoA dehydrogenase [Colwellia sp.]
FENTVAGQQVFGGHGYIREWGQEQLVRDARITQIYEGTNGIQAMDLLVRKIASSKGAMLSVFTDEVNAYIEANKKDVAMAEFITPLNEAVHDLTELTADLLTKSQANINELGASANDYLHVFGYTAMAYIWARMAQVSLAQQKSQQGDSGDDFYQSKLHTARYYFTRLLPRRLSLIASAKSGCDCLFDIDDELF